MQMKEKKKKGRTCALTARRLVSLQWSRRLDPLSGQNAGAEQRVAQRRQDVIDECDLRTLELTVLYMYSADTLHMRSACFVDRS